MIPINISDRFIEYEENHGCHFIGGLLVGGGILGSGLLGFLGSSNAASEQAQAEQNALNFEQQVYGTEQQNLMPYLQGGTNAWKQLLSGMGTPQHPGVLTESPAAFGNLPYPTTAQFKQSPGYQFQLQQGLQAIRDAGSGTSGALSGNTLKALQSYGTGLANQDWYNYLNEYWNRYNAAAGQQQNLWNRFSGVAQAGQSAATLTAPQASLASNIGNIYGQIGSAQAAGTLGGFGSIANTLSPANLQSLYNIFGGGASGGATSGGGQVPGWVGGGGSGYFD